MKRVHRAAFYGWPEKRWDAVCGTYRARLITHDERLVTCQRCVRLTPYECAQGRLSNRPPDRGPVVQPRRPTSAPRTVKGTT